MRFLTRETGARFSRTEPVPKERRPVPKNRTCPRKPGRVPKNGDLPRERKPGPICPWLSPGTVSPPEMRVGSRELVLVLSLAPGPAGGAGHHGDQLGRFHRFRDVHLKAGRDGPDPILNTRIRGQGDGREITAAARAQ
jgi:hypothetical protein